jgi:hypothetical protein
MLHHHEQVGSAPEAGQLLKSPRASTLTASLSSRIDESQLSALALPARLP